ncbi:MAG: L-threonylcarbamoyladenylate synthase, partial [Firmicutes bacterium]|nr:L-threonylcarbamoyladenylate synthase [Bacillota bacterium]
MDTLKLTFKQIDKVASLLFSGEVVAFPTETVYGLGVIYDNEEAFRRLVDAKHRPADKPFTLMCASVEDIEKVAIVDKRVLNIVARLMPGPLTIIVKAKANLPVWVSLHTGKVGLRVSELPFVQEMISKVGKPLLVPSANKSNEPPALSGEQAFQIFNGAISAVVYGPLTGQQPSTIVDIGD